MKPMYLILSITLSLLIVNSAHAARKALLVGIGDYPNVSKLAGPREDVENMSNLLTDSLGFDDKEIMKLIDADASRDGILDALKNWLVKETKPGDEVVFYYSGHGFQTDDLNGDEVDFKDEAIAPYDAKIQDKQVINMITDDEMDDIFMQLDDRSVTMIIDSCHSGTLTRGVFDAESQQYEKTISEFNQLVTLPVSKSAIESHRQEVSFIENTPNRVVWTAVSAWQKALIDFERKNGSVFTNHFISGIQELKADLSRDGIVTRSELLNYLRDESEAFCDRNRRNCQAGLTPTLESSKSLIVENVRDFSNQIANATVSTSYLTDNLLSKNNDDLEVVVNYEGEQLEVGENISLAITSKRSGYLVLLDIDSAGQMTQIFPNKYTDEKNVEGYIASGEILTLPNSEEYGFDFFRAEPPLGKSAIIAIVTQDKILPDDVLHNKDLVVIDAPKQYVENFVHSLSRVWVDGERNRPASWTTKKINYEIFQ